MQNAVWHSHHFPSTDTNVPTDSRIRVRAVALLPAGSSWTDTTPTPQKKKTHYHTLMLLKLTNMSHKMHLIQVRPRLFLLQTANRKIINRHS